MPGINLCYPKGSTSDLCQLLCWFTSETNKGEDIGGGGGEKWDKDTLYKSLLPVSISFHPLPSWTLTHSPMAYLTCWRLLAKPLVPLLFAAALAKWLPTAQCANHQKQFYNRRTVFCYCKGLGCPN